MSFKIATEVGQFYNRSDDESTNTLGTPSQGQISKLISSPKHPKPKSQRSRHHHDSQKRTIGTQALTKAPLSGENQEQGSGWWSRFGKTKGYEALDEIDLTDMATASASIHAVVQPMEPNGDPHSHSPGHTHSHSHDHDHSRDHAHDREIDHGHHHGHHAHTHPNELQSLLPDGATRYMTAVSGSIKKRVVSAFQPPEDPCAPETSLVCMLWDCVHTIAGSKGGDDDHHDHSDSNYHHDHDHGHSHVHTEQYHSHPLLPESMADWADHCSAPCLNEDETVCTEDYHGNATRGHSHM